MMPNQAVEPLMNARTRRRGNGDPVERIAAMNVLPDASPADLASTLKREDGTASGTHGSTLGGHKLSTREPRMNADGHRFRRSHRRNGHGMRSDGPASRVVACSHACQSMDGENAPEVGGPAVTGWRSGRGFTLVEVLVVIAIIGVLAAMLFPVLSKAKGKADRTVCVNNMRQLMIAVTAYGADNGDAMVHPGNDTPDRDCWLYGKGIPLIPGDASEAAIQSQREFQKRGLLYSYYENPGLLYCPKDMEGRMDALQKEWYLKRPIKLSSYMINGAIQGGKLRNKVVKNPVVLKISQYRPDGIVFVEANERHYRMAFLDGASETSNIISQRHDPKTFSRGYNADVGGGSVCASFDGSTDFVRYAEFLKWAGKEHKRGAFLSDDEVPNRAWCFPSPRGGAAKPPGANP